MATYFEQAVSRLNEGVTSSRTAKDEADEVEAALDDYADAYPSVDLSGYRTALAKYRAGLNRVQAQGALLGISMLLSDKPVIGDVDLTYLDASPTFPSPSVVPATGVGSTVRGVTFSAAPTFHRSSVSTAGTSTSGFLTYGIGALLDGVEVGLGSSLAVALDIVTTKTITGVTWFLDGSPVRDNDTDAPYTFLTNGASVTAGSTFSGQGSYTGSSFTLDEGSHTFAAEVSMSDTSVFTFTATITVVPAEVTPGTAYTWPVPGRSFPGWPAPITVNVPEGFPGPSNTGHTTALGSLTPASSFTTISSPGVYEGFHWQNGLAITVPGVIIRNSRVTRASGGSFAVEVKHTSTNPAAFVMEDCTIAAGTQGQAAIGWTWGGRGFTLRRCDISGAGDGLKADIGVHVFDCFIHDQWRGGSAHNDGIQNSGGTNNTNVIIQGNTILAPYHTSTSAVFCQTRVGDIDGVTVRDNFFFGGSYSLYANEVDVIIGGVNYGKIADITNFIVDNNTFCDESTGTSINQTTYVQSSGWSYMIASTGEAVITNNKLLPRSTWQA